MRVRIVNISAQQSMSNHLPVDSGQIILPIWEKSGMSRAVDLHLNNLVLQRSYWPPGMVLGGSAAINGTMWVRGSRHDYNQWASNGAEGWSYAEVLPYFMQMEDYKAASENPGN